MIIFRRLFSVSVNLLVFLAFPAYAGLYIGGGLGSDTVNFKQTSRVFQPKGVDALKPAGFDVLNKTNLSGTGIFGIVFMGYGHFYKEWYLAGEVNANASSSCFSSSNKELVHANFSDTHYKMNNSYGVAILPGYRILKNTLFYGRLGYSSTHFKVSTSDTSLTNISNRLDGFLYGLGFKQKINERFAFRVEYSRILYHDVSMSTFDPLSSVTKNTSIFPQQQLVDLAMIVNFD